MRILVEHGKHGESYYDASDDEKLARACLFILRRNFESGWYPVPEERHLVEPTDVLTDAQIEALPSETLQRAARQERSNKILNYRWWRQQRAWYLEAQATVEANDPGQMITLGRGERARTIPLAWHLVKQRQESEYERTELVETVDLEVARV